MCAPYKPEVFFSLRIAGIRPIVYSAYNGHLTRVKPLGALSFSQLQSQFT
jgi:hypothetical protein